jgi:hypothetical protein
VGLETIAVGAILAATAGSATVQGLQYADARKARKAQEKLEGDRKKQLANEAAAREAAAAKAAASGQRAGLGASAFSSGLGFGSGTTAPGIGAGKLFSA